MMMGLERLETMSDIKLTLNRLPKTMSDCNLTVTLKSLDIRYGLRVFLTVLPGTRYIRQNTSQLRYDMISSIFPILQEATNR